MNFINQSKYVLMCNDLPEIPSQDFGTWRRLKVVPFKAKFVDIPDPTNEFEYKKDYTLKEKLKFWVEPFMALLIKIYKKHKPYSKNSLPIKEPEAVIKHTTKLKNESCPYTEYFKECIIITENKTDRINLKDIYENFRNWYVEGYNNKAPPKKDLRSFIEIRHEGTRQGYRYLKFWNPKEEEDDL